MEIRAIVFKLRSKICRGYSICSDEAHGSGTFSVEEKIPSLIPLTINRALTLSPRPISSQFQSILRGIGSIRRHRIDATDIVEIVDLGTISAMVQLLRTAKDTRGAYSDSAISALHPPPSPHRLSMPCPFLSCHRPSCSVLLIPYRTSDLIISFCLHRSVPQATV
jgi:hypothetical protein